MNNIKYLNEIQNIIEKIINIRIDEIITKSNLNEEIKNSILKYNKEIKENKNNNKETKKDTILNPRTAFIKDASRIYKDEKHLNFLSNEIIIKIRALIPLNYKQSQKLKEYNELWKELDKETIDKYNNICKNKYLTNSKYLNIVNKN